MFGPDSHNDTFLKKLGTAGLHPFIQGLRSQGINRIDDLKKKSIEDVKKIGKKIDMPFSAINRLLEILDKIGCKKHELITKPLKREKVILKKNKESKKNKIKTNNIAESKINSSYYHFLSTSKEEAVRYNAKKINDIDKAKWKTHLGHSSWNPGNTTESKDFTKQAKEKLKQQLLNFPLGNLLITKVEKIEGDFTVICTRGKVKYIYDISFEAEWNGIIGNKKVNGKLEISDIMSDDNYDDWTTICKPIKFNTSQSSAKNIILSTLPEIDTEVIQSILKYIENFILKQA